MLNLKTYILAQTPHCTKPTNVNNPNGKSKTLHFNKKKTHCTKPTNLNTVIQMVSLKSYILAQTSHYRKPTNINNPNV